jgi:hypothetical protein
MKPPKKESWFWQPSARAWICGDCGDILEEDDVKCSCDNIKSVDKFVESLGLPAGTMFRNRKGQIAELIEVREKTCIFGLPMTGTKVEVPIEKVVKSLPVDLPELRS